MVIVGGVSFIFDLDVFVNLLLVRMVLFIGKCYIFL